MASLPVLEGLPVPSVSQKNKGALRCSQAGRQVVFLDPQPEPGSWNRAHDAGGSHGQLPEGNGVLWSVQTPLEQEDPQASAHCFVPF